MVEPVDDIDIPAQTVGIYQQDQALRILGSSQLDLPHREKQNRKKRDAADYKKYSVQ